MAITKNLVDNTLHIGLGENFTFQLVDAFRKTYRDVNCDACIVDFKHTQYMDSSGLGMLLNMRRHFGEDQANIRLINCNKDIIRIFEISKFETLFDIR